MHRGFSKPLTEFTHTLDRTRAFIRGDTVEHPSNRDLGGAELELGAQPFGIVGEFPDQLKSRFEILGCFAKSRSIRSLLRRSLRITNRLRVIAAAKVVMGQLAEVVFQP